MEDINAIRDYREELGLFLNTRSDMIRKVFQKRQKFLSLHPSCSGGGSDTTGRPTSNEIVTIINSGEHKHGWNTVTTGIDS